MNPYPLLARRPWREIALLAQVSMVLAWVVPWFRSLTPGTYAAGIGRPLLLFALLIVSAHYLMRMMGWLRLRPDVQRNLLGGWMVIVSLPALHFLLYFGEPFAPGKTFLRPFQAFRNVFTVFPDEFFVLAAVVSCTLYGASLAGQHVGPRDFFARFRFGVFMLLLFALFNTVVTGESAEDTLLLFLGSALVGLISARLAVLERMRGGRRSPFDWRWGVAMLLALAGTLGAAFFLSQGADSRLVQLAVRLLAWLGALLVGVAFLLLMPVVIFVVTLLTRLFQALSFDDWFPQAWHNLGILLNALRALSDDAASWLARHLPDISSLKPFLLWGGLIFVAFIGIMWLGIRWFWPQRVDGAADIMKPWGRRAVWHYLKTRWQARVRHLLQQAAALSPRGRMRRRAVAHIREVYRLLLEACAEHDFSRQKAQTPLEFLAALETAFPQSATDFRLLTEVYLRVRYGEYPEILDEVHAVDQAWERVQKVLAGER